MAFGEDTSDDSLKINNEEVEKVDHFVYLGSLITSGNNCTAEIKRRIGVTSGAIGNL